jgi:hypothetical protein
MSDGVDTESDGSRPESGRGWGAACHKDLTYARRRQERRKPTDGNAIGEKPRKLGDISASERQNATKYVQV